MFIKRRFKSCNTVIIVDYIKCSFYSIKKVAFSYFFLVMLKAYDEKTSVGNINSVYDALGISTYEPGTQNEIGYGSNTYYYTVTETEARFSALYIQPAETLDL